MQPRQWALCTWPKGYTPRGTYDSKGGVRAGVINLSLSATLRWSWRRAFSPAPQRLGNRDQWRVLTSFLLRRGCRGGRDAVCPWGGLLSAPVSDWQSLWAGPLSSRAVGSLPLFVLHNVETAQIPASAIAPAALTASQILSLCSPCRAIHMRHTGLRAEMAQHGHPGPESQGNKHLHSVTQGDPGCTAPCGTQNPHATSWMLMAFMAQCMQNSCLPLPSTTNRKAMPHAFIGAVTSAKFYALEFCKRGLFFLIGPLTALQWALVWRIQGILPLMAAERFPIWSRYFQVQSVHFSWML